MAILNYTTKIAAARTVGELQAMLSQHADSVHIRYGPLGSPNGPRVPLALEFTIQIDARPVNFLLPCRWEGVLKALWNSDVAVRYCTEEHALRVAWRIIKDWSEAQLALVQAQQADLAEAFLPYALLGDGSTLYEQFKVSQHSLPPPAKDTP